MTVAGCGQALEGEVAHFGPGCTLEPHRQQQQLATLAGRSSEQESHIVVAHRLPAVDCVADKPVVAAVYMHWPEFEHRAAEKSAGELVVAGRIVAHIVRLAQAADELHELQGQPGHIVQQTAEAEVEEEVPGTHRSQASPLVASVQMVGCSIL